MDSPGRNHRRRQSTSISRVRIVQGSCWSCRKRRVKCDLTKPSCVRCTQIGATCDYNNRLIRWSSKHTLPVSPSYQILDRGSQVADSLSINEKRALAYFQGRFWPLMSTASTPCAPPVTLALEQRVLLLAICLIADRHRVLQDGRNSLRVPQIKRVECLAAVRDQLNEFCASGKGPMVELLLSVLMLYFHDGYLECAEKSASTSSHQAGVRAIIDKLGGGEAVLDIGPECLHMLVSEFASTDLTTTMLRGGLPYFSPGIWDRIEQRSAWWDREPLAQCSLASVFGHISSMVHYHESINSGLEELQPECIRQFEFSLTPSYATHRGQDLYASEIFGWDETAASAEAVHAFSLIRSFQHAALIYLYRAICGLPARHPLVQQHVMPCLSSISGIERPSRVLNCVILPLLIAGAHVQSIKDQKCVVNMVNSIYSEIKFASVQLVSNVLDSVWRLGSNDLSWFEMFVELGPDTVVL
ncbi:hypothetical protein V2G26_004634 [Clonostachys chloroleuca]